MPTKVFTVLGGACPFGKATEVDSPQCRRCEYYFRAGMGTFFWCMAVTPKTEPEKPKRGRPKGSKSKKAEKRPFKAREKKRQ